MEGPITTCLKCLFNLCVLQGHINSACSLLITTTTITPIMYLSARSKAEFERSEWGVSWSEEPNLDNDSTTYGIIVLSTAGLAIREYFWSYIYMYNNCKALGLMSICSWIIKNSIDAVQYTRKACPEGDAQGGIVRLHKQGKEKRCWEKENGSYDMRVWISVTLSNNKWYIYNRSDSNMAAGSTMRSNPKSKSTQKCSPERPN